jgi:hypothetical protein
MPVNVVRTPEEEIVWERVKTRARGLYPDAAGERFYRIVMAIYKKNGSLPAATRAPSRAWEHHFEQMKVVLRSAFRGWFAPPSEARA